MIKAEMYVALLKRAIEWTGSRWNPCTGCTRISAGCKNCYMMRQALRNRSMEIVNTLLRLTEEYFPELNAKEFVEQLKHEMKPEGETPYEEELVLEVVKKHFGLESKVVIEELEKTKYWHGTAVTLHPEALDEPLELNAKIQRKIDRAKNKGEEPDIDLVDMLVFVCSMSDIFHEDVPFEFVDKVFDTIRKCNNLIFQILTKRSHRMEEYFRTRSVPENVWLGVTVERQDYIHRIRNLANIESNSFKFISAEPLLGPLAMLPAISEIDMVIVGGESGPKKSVLRKMELEWVDDIQLECEMSDTAFFFKQTGTLQPCTDEDHKCGNKGCKMLRGKIYHEFPVIKQ